MFSYGFVSYMVRTVRTSMYIHTYGILTHLVYTNLRENVGNMYINVYMPIHAHA